MTKRRLILCHLRSAILTRRIRYAAMGVGTGGQGVLALPVNFSINSSNFTEGLTFSLLSKFSEVLLFKLQQVAIHCNVVSQ